MDETPSFSGINSGDHFESTPNTPIRKNNKRGYPRKLRSEFDDDSLLDTSSSHNDSSLLVENLNQLDIKVKQAKLSTSTPTTPLNKTTPTYHSAKGGYLRNNSVLSPIKESREILYRTIPSRLTPRKRRIISLEKSPNELLIDVTNNKVIMGVVFNYLSNGDLYRFSMVCKSFREAVFNDFQASQRYVLYKEVFKVNKENYVITPPGSPEHNDPVDSLMKSGASQIFCEFVSVGQVLKTGEYLDKCFKCGHPSVIINNLGQCQNKNCGYIYCKLCSSCSSDPDSFVDSCNNSHLDRSKLGDLSNNDSFRDSGFHSTPETPISAKRRLFGHKENLLLHNRIEERQKRRVIKKRFTVIPVIKGERSVSFDSPSPSPSPPPKNHPLGTKQCKKKLRRLVF